MRQGARELPQKVSREPKQKYDVELDDREMFEVTADAGGIIQLPVPRKTEIGVRLRAASPAGL